MNGTKPSLVPVGALFRQSWNLFIGRFWTLIAIGIFYFAATGTVGALYLAIVPYLSSSVKIYIVSFLLYVLATILYSWAFLASVYAVKDGTSAIDSYKLVVSDLISFVWVYILLTLIIFGGLIMGIVPALIFAVWFFASFYIVAAERLKGMDALLKSKEYVRGYWWPVALRLFAITLIYLLLGLILGMLSWAVSVNKTAEILVRLLINLPLISFYIVYLYLLYVRLADLKPELAGSAGSGKKRFFVFSAAVGTLIPVLLIALPILLTEQNKMITSSKDEIRKLNLDGLYSAVRLYHLDKPLVCEEGRIYKSTEGTMAVDGTGWLPVNFQEMPYGGSPLSALYVDPDNDADHFYSFSCDPINDVFELNAVFESGSREFIDLMENDGGDNPRVYEIGNDPGLDLIN